MSYKVIFGIACAVVFGLGACKPRTFNAGVQSMEDSAFVQQFEMTRFTTCKDSKGNEAGGFNFVWRVKRANGETVVPYILGFSGSAQSKDGQTFEFRSVSTIDEPRYLLPDVKPEGSFPVPSYWALSLQYPQNELKNGWGFQKINGKDTPMTDITGALLLIPRYSNGDGFASRYFIVTNDRKTLEFNCQPVSDAVRERIKTYLVSDGSHGFKGDRGPVVSTSAKPVPSPTAVQPTPNVGNFDLRPVGRPASYDTQFRHERIYNCGANGAIDVIWRKATSAGVALATKEQYILGFSGQLSDPQSKKSIAFSSVSVDSAPAFSAGEAPAPVSYLSPMFVFTESEIKDKWSFHSPIPGLVAGRSFAAGGTLWIPFDGSGNSVSIAIATGVATRGPAYQVIADCTPTQPKIPQLITGCIGRETVGSCVR